jgi:hypothetical protein
MRAEGNDWNARLITHAWKDYDVMPLQVIEDIPCYTSVELLEKHNCDICAHGGMAMYCQLAHHHSLE